MKSLFCSIIFFSIITVSQAQNYIGLNLGYSFGVLDAIEAEFTEPYSYFEIGVPLNIELNTFLDLRMTPTSHRLGSRYNAQKGDLTDKPLLNGYRYLYSITVPTEIRYKLIESRIIASVNAGFSYSFLTNGRYNYTQYSFSSDQTEILTQDFEGAYEIENLDINRHMLSLSGGFDLQYVLNSKNLIGINFTYIHSLFTIDENNSDDPNFPRAGFISLQYGVVLNK